MKFEELNLNESILKNLNRIGYEDTTEIQALCIPAILKGSDIIGLSQTGSGKTLAYGIPAVMQIEIENNRPQVLVVCPTRELATQICDEIKKITNESGLKVVPVYGGSNMDRQIVALKRAHIVVGTPGRLMDHLRRRTLKLNELKTVVLDEADEMLNMGFREDIETILESTPGQKQMVMFSATMPKAIMDITNNYMSNPIKLTASKGLDDQRFIEQHYISVARNQKNEALVELFKTLQPNTAIIFCNTKKMVDDLGQVLAFNGIMAVCMHGDKRQSERKRILDGIKKDGKGILIGTDVVARGIDINNVDAVINFDMPADTENYIHRIGRTARAGKTGKAFSIVNTKNQKMQIREIEHETKNVIKELKLSVSVEDNSEDKKFFSKSEGRSSSGFAARKNNGSRFSKPYEKRSSERNFSKPYAKRDGEERYSKPYAKKENDSEFKTYEKRDSERNFSKPYEKRDSERNFSKPYEKRDGEQTFSKPYEKRESGRSFSKPYVKKDDNTEFSSKPRKFFNEKREGEKPFGEKKYSSKTYGEKKFEDKEFSDKKFGSKRFEDKKFEDKKFGAKKFEDRKFGDDKGYSSKPYSKDNTKKQYDSKKSFGFKKDGVSKPSSFKKKYNNDN